MKLKVVLGRTLLSCTVILTLPCFAETDAIHEAMLESDLSKDQLIDHAANRLGYGVSSFNAITPQSILTSPTQELMIKSFADRIGQDLKNLSPLGYHKDLAQFIKALSVTIDGNVIDPTLTNEEILEIYSRYGGPDATVEAKLISTRIRGTIRAQSQQMKVLRAAVGSQLKGTDGIYRDRQVNVKEILREFWFNHFNVDVSKAHLTFAGSDGYEHTIHTKMYTTFNDLLSAVIKSPAMILYLDNQINTIIPSQGYIASNQNLGRELLELHTLGVGPSETTTAMRYSQKDVEDASRILAGHNLAALRYQFNSHRSYKNEYRVNGQTVVVPVPTVMKASFPAEGEKRLEDLLRFLANHPQTKSNICRKLTRTFIASKGGLIQPVLQRCIEKWGDGGDLKEMYKSIIASKEFWSKANYANKVKNPLELVISQVRQNGLSLPQLAARPISDGEDQGVIAVTSQVVNLMKKFGFDPRYYPEPTGYDPDGYSWLNKGYLVSAGQSAFKTAHLIESVDMAWGVSQDHIPRERALARALFDDLFSPSLFSGVPLIFKQAGQVIPVLSLNNKKLLTCHLTSEPSIFMNIRGPASIPERICEAPGPKLNKRLVNGSWVSSLAQTGKDLSTSTKEILYK